jgi:hypothetical protein
MNSGELAPLKFLIRGARPLRITGWVEHRTATPATENDSDNLPLTSELSQRPRTTSLPRVRIEEVRGSRTLVTAPGQSGRAVLPAPGILSPRKDPTPVGRTGES